LRFAIHELVKTCQQLEKLLKGPESFWQFADASTAQEPKIGDKASKGP